MDGSRRLSQAISEGDGISLIALVGDTSAAAAAESAGAEGIALTATVHGTRDATTLPLLYRGPGAPQDACDSGADAYAIVVEEHDDEGRLEELSDSATALGLEVVADVHDDESLQFALERIDPEIILLSAREADDEDEVERVLDLLPDVPAGKLAIADLRVTTREQVDALERAGVDAVLVHAADVLGLVGDVPPDV